MNCGKVVAVGRSGHNLFCRQEYGHPGPCDIYSPKAVFKVYETPFYRGVDPLDLELDRRAGRVRPEVPTMAKAKKSVTKKTADAEIRPGRIVRLLSDREGKIEMTVESVSDRRAICSWLDTNLNFVREEIATAALTATC